jgi:hypothetical protein
VQSVTAVADGLVWVSEPAGQGLDTQFSQYDASTLQLRGTHSGSLTEQIVGTSSGALTLSPPAAAAGCTQSTSGSSSYCVSRIASSGSLTDAVSVGMGITLLGPDPAVIANGPAPTAFELERIT